MRRSWDDRRYQGVQAVRRNVGRVGPSGLGAGVCVHRKVLGAELSARLHGGEDGWRGYQETAVRRALTDASISTWVAEVEATVVGFVSAHLTGDRQIGEIFMLAVDPEQQGEGIGTTLTEVATDWLRASGALVALVETGGDPGHAPARRVYEKAAYTMLPIARYFRLL